MVLSKIIALFREVRFQYFTSKSVVRGKLSSNIDIASGVKITNSKIYVDEKSTLTIGKGCVLNNVTIVVDGDVSFGENNIIYGGRKERLVISLKKGTLKIGNYNRINSKIDIRFGGLLEIGHRNNINSGSEIRADEKVIIGSFNQISYNCIIWDTNTHNIYDSALRRDLTVKHFPVFGYEFEKPKTKPIIISDDCWIGRQVSVLKGVEIRNSSIIGFGTTLSNCIIEEGKVVVPKIENNIFDRKF